MTEFEQVGGLYLPRELAQSRLPVYLPEPIEDGDTWLMTAPGSPVERRIPRIRGGSVNAAYRVVTATVFAMTAGAKTALLAIAPAGHGLALTEVTIAFDGVTATAVPALCEIVQSTQATAGTSGVTPTITQVRGRSTSGSAPTGGSNYTAEPTALTRIGILYVPQFMGTYVYQLPMGRELETDSSAGTIRAIGLRINVSANVNFVGSLEVEALG